MNPKKDNPKINKAEEPSTAYEISKIVRFYARLLRVLMS